MDKHVFLALDIFNLTGEIGFLVSEQVAVACRQLHIALGVDSVWKRIFV